MGVEDLYRLAWKRVPALPPRLGYALFHAGADAAWAIARVRHSKTGVGLLRRNLARLAGQEAAVGSENSRASGCPEATSWHEARLAMRSYMRYFYEAFALQSWTPEQIRARVHAELPPRAYDDIAAGSIVVALPHMGNWDLVGAWASAELAPVLTVAERLKPEDLFEQFVAYRENLGMVVIGQSHGEKVFDKLLERARHGHHVVALLADRDLSSSGIPVQLAGYTAHVAAGPAAIATRLNLPLYAVSVSYEKLDRARAKAAGGPWGVVLTLTHIPAPVGLEGREKVAAWTAAWVKALEPQLVKHRLDWHMLQAVFAQDLDQERLARRWAAEAAASKEQEDHGSTGRGTFTTQGKQEETA